MATKKTATLRRARSGDVEGILHVEHSSFELEAEKFHHGQILGLIANPRANVWVATEPGGRVLGWAAGLLRRVAGGRSGRVYALAVSPEARGMGLGRKLFVRTLRVLRASGAGSVYLEVRSGNEAAIRLYRTLGFEEVWPLPHYYDQGVHGVRMRLRPAPSSGRP